MNNFHVTGKIDGRKTPISFGPRGKDGGFTLKIYQRSKGEKVVAFEIWGRVDSQGNIVLTVDPNRSLNSKGLEFWNEEGFEQHLGDTAEIKGLRVRSER